ncbi:MAG TPA: serine/threonine protein kinase [Verrucomicrobiales bacterium]|nr:serine/threonine protein kinase [Verrucomicrobiales bacterium]|tara:strand:- start:220 stop:1437 length:1218 start_codon:yes stop_codon:yes gene_type:complete
MKNPFAIAALALATTLQAGDWPQFRGPSAQGHANVKLPINISADSPHLKWKAPVPGSGWSSPVIVGGKIYLTSAIEKGEGLSLNALCLNADDGKLIWNTPIFGIEKAPRMHRKNSQASPTPIVDGKKVYVHFGHMGTAALGLDGKLAWKNDTIKYPPVHGNGGTPALVDGKLIFSCDGARDPFVIALNTKDGKQAWKVNRSVNAKRKFSFCTPLVLKTANGTQVLLPGSDMIGAYDPANGKEIWRVNYDGYSVVPRPVVGHGMVFFSTGFDRAKAMAVQLGGKGDVTETHVKWVLPKGAPHTPSMVLTGNELFMVSDGGIASCVDAKSGEVHWSERLGGGCSASPILANGKLYVVNEAGTVYVVDAGKEFNVLSKKSLGERSLASPAVADDALFIRTTEHLWRFQ